MLRSLATRLLTAVDFIHSADVVHGSLSSGSVLMNASTDITRPDDDLVVKLDGGWLAGQGRVRVGLGCCVDLVWFGLGRDG